MKKILAYSLLLLILSCSSNKIDVYDAARQGNIEALTEAHSEDKKSIDIPNENGHTPLILSCYRAQPEAAKLLIGFGVDINYSCDLGTALHAAVYQNDFEITKLLLKNKADINTTDANKQTALIMAVNNSNPEMVELLLKHNADVTIADKNGRTAFMFAMEQRNEEIIQLLTNNN